MSTKSTSILEATLRLIGSGGLQSVTHRTVAKEAGVSMGAITHHFPSRELLLHGALRLVAQREIERLERLALDLMGKPFDSRTWAHTLAAEFAARLTEDPIRQLASYELLLASARDTSIRSVLDEWNAANLRVCALAMRLGGSPDPDLHAQIVVATITGLLLKQLAYPNDDFEKAVLRPVFLELFRRFT